MQGFGIHKKTKAGRDEEQLSTWKYDRQLSVFWKKTVYSGRHDPPPHKMATQCVLLYVSYKYNLLLRLSVPRTHVTIETVPWATYKVADQALAGNKRRTLQLEVALSRFTAQSLSVEPDTRESSRILHRSGATLASTLPRRSCLHNSKRGGERENFDENVGFVGRGV